jgi:SAM-dependent methyltransferase
VDPVSRSEPSPDVWGRIFRDQLAGIADSHVIERDDGFETRMDSAEIYFTAPRSEPERRYLDSLAGPVLDLGAGAGSHALYLQDRGLPVTAIDASEGAVEVCRRRGCRDARVMDSRSLELEREHYGAIIVMGNTLGLEQTPETLPALLGDLARASRSDARLLVSMLDPLDTTEPRHLAYHRRNLASGRPPGLARIRLRYRGLTSAWANLWMPTRDEIRSAVAGTGWAIVEEESVGPSRLRLLERTAAGNPSSS